MVDLVVVFAVCTGVCMVEPIGRICPKEREESTWSHVEHYVEHYVEHFDIKPFERKTYPQSSRIHFYDSICWFFQ